VSRRGWLPVAVGAGVALNTVRLRRRLSALAVIEPADGPVGDDHVFLLAAGVHVDDAQRRAASAHAASHGLDVLDLVPEHLTADRLLDLARMLDTTTYRGNRLAWGRGAHQALLVHRDVLARAGVLLTDASERDLVAVTETLKRHAPVTTGMAVLPGLRAAARTGAVRLDVQRVAYRWNPVGTLGPTTRDLALAAGATAAPGWTLAAAAASWLQPALVFGKVPMFYYALHFALIHAAAVAVCYARYHDAHWMFESADVAHYPFTAPPGWGYPLPIVYAIWIAVVVSLFPVCRWFAGVKQRRHDAWLSYL